MNDYGEPWGQSQRHSYVGIACRDGKALGERGGLEFDERVSRAVACVNALAGLDPAAVVELLAAAKRYCLDDQPNGMVIAAHYKALLLAARKLWPEKEAAC